MAARRHSAKDLASDTTSDPVVWTGTEGKDKFEGTAGADYIDGLGGNDVLRAGAGDDELRGGSGDDRLWGGNGHDVLRGQSGNDQLYGGYGRDRLYGNTGDDYLDGGNGIDVMTGGMHNDTYIVDDAGDTVVELAGEGDWDTVYTSVSYAVGAHVEQLFLTGTADINGTGNEQNNRITGTYGNNLLIGLGGDDTLSGDGGDDTLIGGAGDDDYTVWVGFGNVTIVEEAGGGIDSIHTGADEDGTYTLAANLENAYIDGQWDQGTILYGNDADNYLQLWSENRDNEVYGYGGNDHINMSIGGKAYGGDGDDFVQVWSYWEHIVDGGAGNDTLEGYYDVIYTGGEGNDRFRFWSSDPVDDTGTHATVTDFESGIDTLELRKWLFYDEDEPFTENNFYSGSGAAAHDADDRIIFDTDTGILYYDPDGTGTDEDIRSVALIQGDNVTFNDIAVTEF